MSYDENDAARDAFYDQISDELFPEHKEIAIDQFIEERQKVFLFRHISNIRLIVVAVANEDAEDLVLTAESDKRIGRPLVANGRIGGR